MEIDCPKSDVCENDSNLSESGPALPNAMSKSISDMPPLGQTSETDSGVRTSKLDVKKNETQSTQQVTDNENQLAYVQPTADTDVQQSDLSVYNFDTYSSNLIVGKRSRGRPRKDKRSPVQVQHRKMLRGRGRPKREDSCSTSIPQSKIFPGRPRVRAKKIRQLFLPSSHNVRIQPVKHGIESICDIREPPFSGETILENLPVSSKIPIIKSGGLVDTRMKCSLCNLGDQSCLGQGKLKSYRPTPGFSPGRCADEPSLLEDRMLDAKEDHLKISFKKRKSLKLRQENIKLRHQKTSQIGHERLMVQNPADELVNVGFDSPPEIKHVFQTSGETYVHLNCAIWSEGVVKTDEDFVNVEKAVLNGMFQKCVRCDRYGATVKCNTFDCDRIYHYPCAIASGVLQIVKTFKVFCPSHLDSISNNDIICPICKLFGNVSDLLMCTLCFKYYHGKCLEPNVDVNSIVRSGWQCVSCKTCQACKKTGDENKMLVCEMCDKACHTFCAKPMVQTVPKSGWTCQDCRVCGDCGARTPGSGPSSRWHLNYTVCDSCYQQRNKGVACPLCGKAYRQFSQRKEMRHCCVCRKYIHVECDQRPEDTLNPLEYVCPICVNPVDVDDNISNYGIELLPKGRLLDSNISPPEVFLSSSRESFSSDNGNSFSSGESDSCSEMTSGKPVAKRRAKTAEFRRRRKKSPKAKLKSYALLGSPFLVNPFSEPKEYKTEDDDPSTENKMVLVSATDEFVLCQDLCVMCGSFGKGDEGRLIACAQCGQCYHSYCASIKVTPVVLKKGWRCLDCTVCEGCGQPHDEGRLLLCDECDISFHIYCLDPPLTEVPPGNWKCKWCVVCVKCGTRSPGFNCNWQMNYTHCGPCASFTTCSVCSDDYLENDLVIQCSQCQRWCHGKCDQIETEESAEKCADYGYVCILCRPADEPPPHLTAPTLTPSPEPEPVPEKPPSPVPKVKEQDVVIKSKPPVQFYLDGICLSENGLQHIKSLTLEMPKKVPRPRKPRQTQFVPGLLPGSQVPLKYPSIPSFSTSERSDLSSQVCQGSLESSMDIKSETEMKAEADDEIRMPAVDNQKEFTSDEFEKKKRPRKIQKLGIGGFVVKPRGRSSSVKELTDPSTELPTMVGESLQIIGSESSETITQEKPKRRRKPKKKTPLDESFPSYLRDAFFGKDLLMACKKSGPAFDLASQDDMQMESVNLKLSSAFAQQSLSASSSVESVGRAKVIDTQVLSSGGTESFSGNQALAIADMKPSVVKVISEENLSSGISGKPETTVQSPNEVEAPLTLKIKEEASLSLDGNSKDGPTGESVGFPQIDSKDVEDVIEGALRDHVPSQVAQIRAKENLNSRMSGFLSDASNSPVNVSQPQTSSPFPFQRGSSQIHTQSSPVHRENTPSLHHQDSNSSWSESESSDHRDSLSQMPKSTMKWESDEALGLLSTISPVLYANINCPHLKLEYPNWADRVKQIAKIWRSLPSEKRQPYLQKARENRAQKASRTQKTNDAERSSKETKIQEIDQEKQWKQFQALRQLQQQKQQKILQEQRAQALMKAQTDKPEPTTTFSDINMALKSGKADVLQEAEASGKELTYEKGYGKKLGLESSAPKIEELPSPNLSQQQQTQFSQGKVDHAVQSTSQARQSQFIQVSRVRPPLEPSKIPVGDSVSLIGSPNLSPVEHYGTTQTVLTPRCPPPQPNRMPYSPTSPVSRQSLLISRAEMARVTTPSMQKEILYTPPSTPRPQNSDTFFQASVPSRAQFVPFSVKSPLVNQFPSEVGSSVSASTTDSVTSPKPFFSQPQNADAINRPTSNPQKVPVSQSNVESNSNRTQQAPNILPSNHFLHQQPVPVSPVGSSLVKNVMSFKDEVYSSMPGTPRPSGIPTQESIVPPQQTLDHILKENPDPNKLMAHHQLRELLQKQQQQLNKPEDVILQIRNKESPHLNQWPKGTYNATSLQFMSKDDCFRHPFPPAVRTRSLSAKDSKPDVPSEILSSSCLKLDLLPSDDSSKDDKTVSQTNDSLVSMNVTPPQHCETQQHGLVASGSTPPENEGKVISLPETKTESVSSSTEDDTKNVQEITQVKLQEEGNQPSEFVLNPDKVSSPGISKKRKTTAGDIVKDLESEPNEHDSIANACNLDVLPGDVGELELDDDELLGLGNDFNILEYADPELDKGLVGEGEKSNILDEHLDLDDKDELEEEEEEIKEQTDSEEKSLISGDVPTGDNGILRVDEVPNIAKSTEKCESAHLHDEFLEFEKKDDKNNYKSIATDTPPKSMAETVNLIKSETKVSFTSCNVPNVGFCSSEDLNLKAEVPSVKDLQVPSQPSMPFTPAVQGLSPEEASSTFPPHVGPPHYRVGNVVRQSITSHFQQPTLVSQQRSIFPLHVGLPVRSSVPNVIAPTSQQSRPLLLQEQPLLLEDLVEQEKREQNSLRQTQDGLISPQGDALLSDIDFERLKDDVFSGPPDDSLGGPGSLLGSHEPLKPVISPASSSSSNSASSHNFGPPPYSLIWQNQEHNVPCPVPPRSQTLMQTVQQKGQVPNVLIGSLGLPPGIVLHGEPPLRAVQPQKTPPIPGNVPFGPNMLPPSPPVLDAHTEQEKQKILQYEKFLLQQQAALSSQQKYFETEVMKLRKVKKALNAKQRQLRKNGSELAENDAVELARISQEQASLQKQLDQVRKQSRQHAIALQDYRVKQQKRQQQQSPVHVSISSLQSSPQNSPHQMVSGAPQSPMLPSSPLGPSPSHVQHSPSPMMPPSSASVVSPSAVVQQPSPLVHSHLMPQQVHFQMSRSEGKSWPNSIPISQIPDNNAQQNERFIPKESLDKCSSNPPATSISANLPESSDSKGHVEVKPKIEQESGIKRFFENDPQSLMTKSEEQNSVLKIVVKSEISSDTKPDVAEESEQNVSKSILSQSLPSSVTNTLNFTLRQTGMPTGCLPASDQAPSDEPAQVSFIGLSTKKTHIVVEQQTSDPRPVKSEVTSGTNMSSTSDVENVNFGHGSADKSLPSPQNEPTIAKDFPLPSSSALSKSACEERVFSFEMPVTSALKLQNTSGESNMGSSHSGDHNIEAKNDVVIREDAQKNSEALKIHSYVPASTFGSGSSVEFRGSQDVGNRDDLGENTHVLVSTIKKEVISCDDESHHGVAAASHSAKNINDGSSDEEVENLSKEMAGVDAEHEQGKQNVLLKQLLQNCPSAESSCKQEPPVEVKKEGPSKSSMEDTSYEETKDPPERKGDDPKLKKPSYLDIRRAQLEKEPTPPPGEAKTKAPKRKRPKKKKLDGKEGSPVRKKCRKGSLSKADDTYNVPLENLMTQLTNLPPLRILEPNIQPNHNILPVFGAGDLNTQENQLKGTYGNATLPNHCDVYSYYPYGKEHAAVTVALPPSPPYRGFYNQEFPAVTKGKQETSLPAKSGEILRDVQSPDTVISSSSPESCLFEPLGKWPELIFIDHIDQGSDEKKSYSPVIPLVAPIPIRLVPYPMNEISTPCDFDSEKDKENIPRSSESKPDINLLKSKITGLGSFSTPLKDTGNVAVTLTLSSAAAEDICGVLSRLADFLKIPIPSTYEIVERTATPPSQKLGLYRKSKSSEMNIHSLLNGKPRFCRHCDIVVLSAGIRKKACDLTCISKEEQEEEEEIIFCSTNCYMQFALTHRSSSSVLEDKEAAAVVSHPGENILKHGYSKNTVKSISEERQGVFSDGLKPVIDPIKNVLMKDVVDSLQPRTDGKLLEALDSDGVATNETVYIKSEPISELSNLSEEPMHVSSDMITEKGNFKEEQTRWKSVRYKFWSSTSSAIQVYKPQKDDQTEKVTKPFYHTIKPPQMPKDGRTCILCHASGDGDTNGAARLLNVDVDKWIHLNCALWSAEVYETQNGALMNVETAYKRALMLVCCSCHRNGASLKCFKIRCSNIYHFTCAMKDHCVFFKDKTLICPHHTSKYTENELESLAVHRRVYIDRDEHKQVASMIQGDQYVMRVGSLVFLSIGQLLPQQMQAFHTPNCIYPVGYKAIRMYWSMRKLGRRCQYICSINDINGKPEFHIQVKEADHKDIILRDKTPKGLWQKVLYPIEKMRREAKTIKIFPDFITGDDLFGLTEPAVLRIIESLPGVETLQDYNFRYGRSPFLELPLAINPTGCARSEPKLRTHVKRSHTLHTSNSSRTSFHSTFGGIEISSPYIKQFVHSKSSQYRQMKTEWRNNVYLARSRIQGLGLYAARDLEKHTMVIEYIGQLIRNEIAERNEAIYDAQNRGIYMFRLDENRVIDATLCGGLARYMNHSCNPNCVAEVVKIDRENKILIITNRRISRGEELSYDYKFEVEDDQHKIPCLCKAPNCRKWMN